MPYYINQRWSSELEAELGSGIITMVSFSRIEVYFKKVDIKRTYSAKNAPLKRVKFNIGDEIAISDIDKLIIKDIKEENYLLFYLDNNHTWIPEKDIGNEIPSMSVLEKLLNGEWNTSGEYNLRSLALDLTNMADHNPNRGLIGNRIELINHQIYISRKISSSHQVRVLLADEMGLGKTIEACLILNRLLSLKMVERVLIVVPESLILQWFVELYRKFNLIFTIFDPETFENISSDEKNNQFSSSQFFIVSQKTLTDKDISISILSEHWDLLIIDEVHHLKINDENKKLENFIIKTNNVILITATPTEFGENDHFQRLNILDRDRFHDFSQYLKEKNIFPKIGKIANKLFNKKMLTIKETESLSEILCWTIQDVNDFLNTKGSFPMFLRLLDWHGTSRVFFKNSRKNIKGFPKRVFHKCLIQNKHKKDSQISQVSILKHKVEWLIPFIKNLNNNKVLLICHSKETALLLTSKLKTKLTSKIAIFHEDLTLIERDKNAAWFANENGPQILICSEIGSEGRNFQFAHHLILWDLPKSLGLIEQRIGRLDRIGQKEIVNIYFPFINESFEHCYMNWLNDGVNLFEQFFSGIDFIESMMLEESLKIAENRNFKAMKKLITKTIELKKQLEIKLHQGRDFLLEKNSYDEKKGQEWIDSIKKDASNDLLENFMLGYWELIGVNIEPIDKKFYLLKTTYANYDALPEKIPEVFEATFSREIALKREEVVFITMDHPMVTFALDYLLTSSIGQTRFVYCKSLKEKIFYLEAIFILRCPENYLKALGPIVLDNKIKVTLNSKFELIDNNTIFYNQNLLKSIPDNFKEKSLSMFNKLIIKLFDEAKKQAKILSLKHKEESITKLEKEELIEIERLSNLYKPDEENYQKALNECKNNFQNMTEKITKNFIILDSLSFIIQN